MNTEVVSNTVQKFDGVSYYLCGNYYQRKGVRLHRKVWEYHNGEIPEGYDIHHKNNDKSDNNIDNLEMLSRYDHHVVHMKSPERVEKSRRDIAKAISKAPEWHGSEAGKEWHSMQGKENYKKRTMNTYICTFCGKEFQTKHIYGENSNHFCHNNCKAAYRRMLIRNGVIAK